VLAGVDAFQLAAWIGAFAAASVVAGFAAGLLGVGGGIITVPVMHTLFTLMGMPSDLAMQVAVGTSLMTIIPTGFMSARSHAKRGSIDVALIKLWGPLALLGVLAALIVARFVDGSVLQAVFAVVAFLVSVDMILRRDGGKVAAGFPNGFVRGASGFLIGGLSTLMGIGGGTISVPVLSAVGYPIRSAVGTAAALGPVIAIPGAIGFIVNGLGVPGRPPLTVGYVNLVAFAMLLPAGLFMPAVGAKVAHAMPPRALKFVFAAFLLVTSVRMAWSLLRAWT
jgi:uncharacterized membrane protein YfcA